MVDAVGGNLIGQILGQKYRLDALLGRGGLASVYRATQLDLGRTVMIKVLDRQLSSNPGFIERFKREAQATFSLRHPNIVEVYDFQGGEGRYFLVTEFVEGPSLLTLLEERGAFPANDDDELARLRTRTGGQSTAAVLCQAAAHYDPLEVGQAVAITCQLCDALEYAHARGVMHRDVRPENILLTADGVAKLGNFGIAHLQADERLSHLGAISGTPAYMSPEQTMGAPVDARSDIYSLGIVLYELLAGTMPFPGGSQETQQVYRMHQSQPPPSLNEVRPGLPEGLAQSVERMLAKWPAERFPTAGQVHQALLEAVSPGALSGLLQARPQAATPQENPALAMEEAQICPICACDLSSPVDEPHPLIQTPEESVSNDACPLCAEISAPSRRVLAAEHLEQEAAAFVAGLSPEGSLPPELRAYEFRRAIEPELKSRTQEALEEWHAVLEHGPLITPIAPPEAQPDPGQVLACLRGLNALAHLWCSGAVDDYLVTPSARRKAGLHAAELRGRAQMLAGLLWSLRGARAATPQEAEVAYRHSARLWRLAAQSWEKENASWGIQPEEARAAGMCARAAESILRYPQDRPAAEQELLELAAPPSRSIPEGGSTDGASPPDPQPAWYTAGASRLAELAGLSALSQQKLAEIQAQAKRSVIQNRHAGTQLQSRLQQSDFRIRQAQAAMQATLQKRPQAAAWRNLTASAGLFLILAAVVGLMIKLRGSVTDLFTCGLIFGVVAAGAMLILFGGLQLLRRERESKDIYNEQLLTLESRRVEVRQSLAAGIQAVEEFEHFSLTLQERLHSLQAGLQEVRHSMTAAMLGRPLPPDFGDPRPLESTVRGLARQNAGLCSRWYRELEAQRTLAGCDLLTRTCSGQWDPLGYNFGQPRDIELNAAISLQGEGAALLGGTALKILAGVLAKQGYTAKTLDRNNWEFRRGSRLGKYCGFIQAFRTRIQVRLEIPGSQNLVIRLTGRVNARKGIALNPQRLASELAGLGNRFIMGKIL